MANPQHLAIDAYLKELTELAAKRSVIDQRTARIEKAVRAMIDLMDGEPEYEAYLERFDDVVRPAGLTSAIASLLKVAGRDGLTPIEVRDSARSMLIGHSNPVASVHTILKRLVKTGDVEQCQKDGKPAYRWIDSGDKLVRYMYERAAEGLGTPANPPPIRSATRLANAITKAKQQKSGMPPPPTFEDK
jgi:hypothetical protein